MKPMGMNVRGMLRIECQSTMDLEVCGLRSVDAGSSKCSATALQKKHAFKDSVRP